MQTTCTMLGVVLSAALVAGATSCASAPEPPPAVDLEAVGALEGSYEGRLLIEGRPFRATLTLQRSAARSLRGSLVVVSPVEIDGAVEGVVVDGLLRLIVSYEGADGCDGTIAGIFDVAPESPSVTGPVMVDDCRGPVAGALDFRR